MNLLILERIKKSYKMRYSFARLNISLIFDEGFEQRFLDGKVVAIDKRSVPDSQNSYYVDNAVNTYFNTLKPMQIPCQILH